MERRVWAQKTRADALAAAGNAAGARAARMRAREMNRELKGWCAEKGRAYYPERVRVTRAEKAETAPLTSSTPDATMRMMSAEGGRNTEPLTEEQIARAIDFAVSLGMPRENIEYNDRWNTSYWSSHTLDGFAEHLCIGPDLYPAQNGTTANQKISWMGAIGHEIIGHRVTCIRGTNGPAKSAFDEAQASLRAARFTPGLSSYDRRLLRQDAKKRLKREGLSFKRTIRRMDIWRE